MTDTPFAAEVNLPHAEHQHAPILAIPQIRRDRGDPLTHSQRLSRPKALETNASRSFLLRDRPGGTGAA
jgi:hypothetical protein